MTTEQQSTVPLFERTTMILNEHFNASHDFKQSASGQLAASFADEDQLNLLRLSSHYHE